MDFEASFLTFSPKIKKSKKAFTDRRIPKLCLKPKLHSTTSKEKNFQEKWESPSSINNVHKNFTRDSTRKSRDPSMSKEGVKKKPLPRRGKENCIVPSIIVSPSKLSRVTVRKKRFSSSSNNPTKISKYKRQVVCSSKNLRISGCSSPKLPKNTISVIADDCSVNNNKSNNKCSPFYPLTVKSVEIQKPYVDTDLVEKGKVISEKADCDDDSVIIVSDGSVISLDDSGAIYRQKSNAYRTTVVETSSDSSVVQQRSIRVIGETPDSEDLDNSLRSKVQTKRIHQNSTKTTGFVTPVQQKRCPATLSVSRYNAIEKWLEDNSLSGTEETAGFTLPRPQSKWHNWQSKTHLNVSVSDKSSTSTESAERILNEVYGSSWQKDKVLIKNSKTEPRKPKRNLISIRNNSVGSRKKDASEHKLSSTSSSSEDNFDRFIHNVRQRFESTRKNVSLPRTDSNSFIDEDVENNSFTFYHTISNKIAAETKKTHIDRDDFDNAVSKRLFISSDSSDEEQDKTKRKVGVDGKQDKAKKKAIIKPVPKKDVNRKPLQLTAGSKQKASTATATSSSPKTLSFLRSLSASPPGIRCHPRAQIFKEDFNTHKEKLTAELFAMYNSIVFDSKLPANMKLEWNIRMNRTAGFCYNRRIVSPAKPMSRSSRIELSIKVCDTADRLRDTLIHEMCHAAAWIFDEMKGGHGPQWKSWARKAMHRCPDLPPIKRCHEYKIEFKYTYRCTKCGYSIGRHSKSLNLQTKRCGYCLGTFEILVNTKRKRKVGTTPMPNTVRTPRNPTGFALFVKENYGTVKKLRSNLKHGEVMKLLGQQFSAVKLAPQPFKLLVQEDAKERHENRM